MFVGEKFSKLFLNYYYDYRFKFGNINGRERTNRSVNDRTDRLKYRQKYLKRIFRNFFRYIHAHKLATLFKYHQLT